MNIDTMNAMELKIAVAEALGWKPTSESKRVWISPDGDPYPLHIAFLPDWPTDIAAAWELDEDGWRWEFDDPAPCEGDDQELIVTVHPIWPQAGETVIVAYADFPTKAAAYATARCRAYLKAKRAEAER